jgi:hypothetical protein
MAIQDRKTISSNILKLMSNEDLDRRIDLSLEDSDKGRLTEVGNLISEIEKWD